MAGILRIELEKEGTKPIELFCERVATDIQVTDMVDKVHTVAEKNGEKVKDYLFISVPDDAKHVCRNCGSEHIFDIVALRSGASAPAGTSSPTVLDKYFPAELGVTQRIQYFRRLRGLSLEDFAEKVLVSKKHVMDIEAGKLPSVPDVIAMARELSIPASFLMPSAEPPDFTLPEPLVREKELEKGKSKKATAALSFEDELNDLPFLDSSVPDEEDDLPF